MALFKIFKGPQNNLGTVASGTDEAHEGYAYFTTDSGKFYIDIVDAAAAEIGVNRIPLSADRADKDDLGNIIKNTYAASLNLAGHTLKLIAKDGTSVLSTITLPDEDTKVTQNIKSDNNDYRVILSYEANDTDNVTNTVNKASNLRYNPSLNKLSTGNIALTGTLAVTGAATFADNATVTGQLTSSSLLVNGNSSFVNDVTFTKIPTAPTAAAGTHNTQLATTEFVTNAVAQGFVANDAMIFKGLIGSNQPITQLPTSGYTAGWTYRVADAGTFAGEYCEVGDLLIAINDGPASGSSVIGTDWGKVEHNIDGAVFRGSGASNSSVGSSTQPVYVNSSGIVTAITGAIANDTTGNATTATTASKLSNTSKIGDTNKPVYFTANGVPAAINYTIDKSVPSNAVFTDTTYTFTDGTNGFTVTPSGGTAQTVTVTPSVSKSDVGLGNVTNHQQVHEVAWDNTNKKVTRSKNGTAGDVVQFKAGTGISLSADSTSLTITNNATDTLTGTPGAGKTITAFDQVNGAITATFADIAITKSQITDFPTSMTPASHTHGNITNDGKLGTASVAVVTDGSKNITTANLSVTDPTASGTGITYIATISQSAVGKITATKSTVRSASTSQTGVVQLSSATNSTSETLAATAKAVKTAYDLANDHKYWANVESTSVAAYNKAPEMAKIKLNGNTSASAASTKNVELVYDATLEVLNFVFS